ncbi:MAG: indole-3-glycerol phosphate synthase TrpC [Sporomusaceae bacterium]|nr:indole-3-glycerol phosphate synthase TrpC [Sporomusaceae bacterium]
MLNKIVALKRQEVEETKAKMPIENYQKVLTTGDHAFAKALVNMPWALIAECKLASPAKGRLCKDYSVPELAKIYEANGACALSVHTDQHFLGKLSDLAAVKQVSSLPILRKEFIIDAYQIYEARAHGADCVLLIAAILTDKELQNFLAIAKELAMDALVEVHSREELERINVLPVQLVGLNNRNLKTFETTLETSVKLLPHCREGRIVISESGVGSREDALLLQHAGVKGILVGEGLVTAESIAEQTRQFALLK